MKKTSLHTGNKGEWSEFYAFIKLLSDRKITEGDKNLKPDFRLSHKLLKVLRKDIADKQTVYDLTKDEQMIQIILPDGTLKNVPAISVSSKVGSVLEQIKHSENSTFHIAEAEALMSLLECYKIKASSNEKVDINTIIHDRYTQTEQEVGFSVKSLIGGNATLLNASGQTNFTYSVHNCTEKQLNETISTLEKNGKLKIRSLLKELSKKGVELEMVSLDSEQLEANLRKIDTIMPFILGELVKTYYCSDKKYVKDLIKTFEPTHLLQDIYKLTEEDIALKMKNLLSAVALGMTPSKAWDGTLQARGGYLIVKEDGDIIAFFIYNIDNFKDYLFDICYFDTPSTGRHKFGEFYKDDSGKLFIKLNLQIRYDG